MAKKNKPEMVELANKDPYHVSYNDAWYGKGNGPTVTPEEAGVMLDKFSHIWEVVSGTPIMPGIETTEPQEGGDE